MQKQHSLSELENVIGKLHDIFIECYAEPDKEPILRFKTKKEVVDDLTRPAPPQKGMGLGPALDMYREKVLPASIKTWHPMFFNQMSAGASVSAVLGGTLAAMTNGTLSTYEASPAATVIERNVSQWMAAMLGMKPGSSGIFLPGGSMGNLFALIIARNTRLNKNLRQKGLQGIEEQGAIICSQASHYSVSNAANMMGLGADRALKVRTNGRNEMIFEGILEKLAEADERGWRVFAIVATTGITVTGGFDPLQEIAALCKERDIHLHVDAAFGGGMALTRDGAKLFKGIEEADSVVWDAHKWLGVPLTSSLLAVPDADILKQTFSSNAHYLFHKQDEEVAMADDLGHFTPLCGKPFDALPLWLMMHAFGEQFFRDLSQNRLDFTLELAKTLQEDPNFEMAYEPRSPVVCFRYRPPESEGFDRERLNLLQQKIRENIRKKGIAFFNISTIKERSFFRLILINPLTTMEEMAPLLADILATGRQFKEEMINEKV